MEGIFSEVCVLVSSAFPSSYQQISSNYTITAYIHTLFNHSTYAEHSEPFKSLLTS